MDGTFSRKTSRSRGSIPEGMSLADIIKQNSTFREDKTVEDSIIAKDEKVVPVTLKEPKLVPHNKMDVQNSPVTRKYSPRTKRRQSYSDTGSVQSQRRKRTDKYGEATDNSLSLADRIKAKRQAMSDYKHEHKSNVNESITNETSKHDYNIHRSISPKQENEKRTTIESFQSKPDDKNSTRSHKIPCSEHNTARTEHNIAGLEHNIASSEHNIAGTEHNTAGTEHNTAGTEHNIAGLEHNTAGTEHNTAGSEHNIASSEHNTAGTEHNTAGTEHNTAGTEHNTAGLEHNIAGLEHNIAGTEHNTAGTEHNTAGTEHNTACLEHNIACSDHNTAGTENNIAGLEHNIASSDHNTAGTENNIAGLEHNIASSDHNIACPDHNTAGTENNIAGSKHSIVRTDIATEAKDLDLASTNLIHERIQQDTVSSAARQEKVTDVRVTDVRESSNDHSLNQFSNETENLQRTAGVVATQQTETPNQTEKMSNNKYTTGEGDVKHKTGVKESENKNTDTKVETKSESKEQGKNVTASSNVSENNAIIETGQKTNYDENIKMMVAKENGVQQDSTYGESEHQLTNGKTAKDQMVDDGSTFAERNGVFGVVPQMLSEETGELNNQRILEQYKNTENEFRTNNDNKNECDSSNAYTNRMKNNKPTNENIETKDINEERVKCTDVSTPATDLVTSEENFKRQSNTSNAVLIGDKNILPQDPELVVSRNIANSAEKKIMSENGEMECSENSQVNQVCVIKLNEISKGTTEFDSMDTNSSKNKEERSSEEKITKSNTGGSKENEKITSLIRKLRADIEKENVQGESVIEELKQFHNSPLVKFSKSIIKTKCIATFAGNRDTNKREGSFRSLKQMERKNSFGSIANKTVRFSKSETDIHNSAGVKGEQTIKKHNDIENTRNGEYLNKDGDKLVVYTDSGDSMQSQGCSELSELPVDQEGVMDTVNGHSEYSDNIINDESKEVEVSNPQILVHLDQAKCTDENNLEQEKQLNDNTEIEDANIHNDFKDPVLPVDRDLTRSVNIDNLPEASRTLRPSELSTDDHEPCHQTIVKENEQIDTETLVKDSKNTWDTNESVEDGSNINNDNEISSDNTNKAKNGNISADKFEERHTISESNRTPKDDKHFASGSSNNSEDQVVIDCDKEGENIIGSEKDEMEGIHQGHSEFETSSSKDFERFPKNKHENNIENTSVIEDKQIKVDDCDKISDNKYDIVNSEEPDNKENYIQNNKICEENKHPNQSEIPENMEENNLQPSQNCNNKDQQHIKSTFIYLEDIAKSPSFCSLKPIKHPHVPEKRCNTSEHMAMSFTSMKHRTWFKQSSTSRESLCLTSPEQSLKGLLKLRRYSSVSHSELPLSNYCPNISSDSSKQQKRKFKKLSARRAVKVKDNDHSQINFSYSKIQFQQDKIEDSYEYALIDRLNREAFAATDNSIQNLSASESSNLKFPSLIAKSRENSDRRKERSFIYIQPRAKENKKQVGEKLSRVDTIIQELTLFRNGSKERTKTFKTTDYRPTIELTSSIENKVAFCIENPRFIHDKKNNMFKTSRLKHNGLKLKKRSIELNLLPPISNQRSRALNVLKDKTRRRNYMVN